MKSHRAGDLLPACPTETLSVEIPIPLNRRLNEIRDELPSAGVGKGCGKHDLVAAMLQAALADILASDGIPGIAERVLMYWATPARAAMASAPDDDDAIVEWGSPTRGRPRR
jgi:hypothetical protein